MATSWDQHEFSPADIGLFAKWLGWTSPPKHYHNDSSLAEQETWFWVSGDALDALEQSQWGQGHDDEVPILLPEDLPAADGIMVLAEPIRARLQASAAAGTAPRMESIDRC